MPTNVLHRSPRWRHRLTSALALVGLAACADSADPAVDLDTVTQQLYSDVTGAGPLDGLEWQTDAPWRLEPRSATDLTYGPIPLVVTFHDSAVEVGAPATERPYLQTFCGLYVVEDGHVTLIPPEQFHEIEASKRWLVTGELTPGADAHLLRRM